MLSPLLTLLIHRFVSFNRSYHLLVVKDLHLVLVHSQALQNRYEFHQNPNLTHPISNLFVLTVRHLINCLKHHLVNHQIGLQFRLNFENHLLQTDWWYLKHLKLHFPKSSGSLLDLTNSFHLTHFLHLKSLRFQQFLKRETLCHCFIKLQ